MVYMVYAVEPKAAMQRFIASVNSMMHRHTNSTGSESDVVLVATTGCATTTSCC